MWGTSHTKNKVPYYTTLYCTIPFVRQSQMQTIPWSARHGWVSGRTRVMSCHVMSFHGIYFKDCHDHMSYSRSCRGYRVDIAYVLVCGGWIMVYELLLWEITIHVHHGLVISHDMYWLVNESGPWEKCVAYVLTVYDRRGSPFTLHHSSAGRVLESHVFIPPIVQIRPARLGKRYIM